MITNEVVQLDEMTICVEIVFEGGLVPYDVYRVGSVAMLKETISEAFVEQERQKNEAVSAVIQNIYFRGHTENRQWRTEYRVGNRSEIDLEAIIMKEEEQ